MKRYILLFLAGVPFLLLVLFLTINSTRGVRFEVKNISSDELKDVFVLAGGDGAYLGDIASHAYLKGKLIPSRDGVVSVFYKHRGAWVHTDVHEYVTTGASLDIEIKLPATPDRH